jgi:hypothetical protein
MTRWLHAAEAALVVVALVCLGWHAAGHVAMVGIGRPVSAPSTASSPGVGIQDPGPAGRIGQASPP